MFLCKCLHVPMFAHHLASVRESQAMSLVSWLCTLNWAWSSYFNGSLSRV